MSEVADHPARKGDPEYGGEGEYEALYVAFKSGGSGAEYDGQCDVSRYQRADAAEGRIALRRRTQRLAEIAPNRGRHHPADQVEIDERRQRENEDSEPKNDGEPILVDRRDHAIGAAWMKIVNDGIGHGRTQSG